jgi:hypothetical protein
MHNYDFRTLNPIEFETLTNDLLAKHLRTHVERFKPGKDMGIDGRFSITENKTCIIQSKHYVESGFRRLLKELEVKEKDKIDKLAPNQYILSTSVSLSPDNKGEIVRALAPHIKSASDIYGKGELNALISSHPEIERNHYKLWIQSSEVLRTLLNAATYSISEQVVRDAVEAAGSYVVTKAHDQALDKIRHTSVLVITGEPGVGKTTLAEQICLRFVADDYDLVAVENDIQDARSVFDKNKKQIFYFDDFLGRNFLETLRFNEDTQIMKFIKLVQSENNKKFVLTSRTNILDQGYSLGQFNTPTRLKNREYVLKITEYTSEEKARILYSFMWKSGLSQEHLETIVNNKKYLSIVEHNNYNPRILEFITSTDNCAHVASKDYGAFIDRSLSNPVDVWEHPYSVQLDDFSRGLVDLVVLGNASIDEDSLQHAYGHFISSRQHFVRTPGPSDFGSVVKTLSRTFVNRNEIHKYGGSKEVVFTPFNPSISDFVLNKYRNNPLLFAEMLMHFRGCDGLKILDNIFLVNTQLANTVAAIITDKVGNDLFSKSFEFVSMLGCLLDEATFGKIFEKTQFETVENNLNSSQANTHAINFCDRFASMPQCTLDQAAQLFSILFTNVTAFYELEEASNLAKKYTWNEPQLLMLEAKFCKPLMELWQEDVAYDFINDNLDECSTYWEAEYDEEGYYEEQVEVEERTLASLIAESTKDLLRPMDAEEALGILSGFDLEEMVLDSHRSAVEDERLSHGPRSTTSGIENIFDGFIASKFGQ